MPAPNRKIDLSVDDMELIETALRARKAAQSAEDTANPEIREIHELLGRLHNQKVFFRPKKTRYIGG